MPRRTRSQNRPASNLTSPQASSSEVPRKPGKEQMVEQVAVEATQMTNRQAQLEEAVGVMSQEIGTIKQLLERLLVLRAPTATRVKLLLKSGAPSNKPLEPPHVVKRPQDVVQTLSRSPIRRPNLPTQLHQVVRGRTPRLDHPDLTTKRFRAFHRSP